MGGKVSYIQTREWPIEINGKLKVLRITGTTSDWNYLQEMVKFRGLL
jgi:hypothetical protein